MDDRVLLCRFITSEQDITQRLSSSPSSTIKIEGIEFVSFETQGRSSARLRLGIIAEPSFGVSREEHYLRHYGNLCTMKKRDGFNPLRFRYEEKNNFSEYGEAKPRIML
ncbi:MAG TPA: hypothetical protein VJG30_02190 [Candidatus Nanoarchaeia archaeon]|nr:hypothetical protein [Candidatus Nanoarchaeia archaeon]